MCALAAAGMPWGWAAGLPPGLNTRVCTSTADAAAWTPCAESGCMHTLQCAPGITHIIPTSHAQALDKVKGVLKAVVYWGPGDAKAQEVRHGLLSSSISCSGTSSWSRRSRGWDDGGSGGGGSSSSSSGWSGKEEMGIGYSSGREMLSKHARRRRARAGAGRAAARRHG